MKSRRKNKARVKGGSGFPVLKKHIEDFLLSEEGKISQKDIMRIGVSLAALGTILSHQQASAVEVHTNNWVTGAATRGGHNSHTQHASHGSHASHGATWH